MPVTFRTYFRNHHKILNWPILGIEIFVISHH